MKTVLFIIVTALCCGAQQSTTDPAMIKFFGGDWRCAGAFSNGKKIEADMKFTSELDGKWLSYRHTDRPPGAFKAFAIWGVESGSGQLISIMTDNFGSARVFTSEGWRDGSVTFTSATLLGSQPGRERFRYERQSDNSFKMIWERSIDGQWKMGDDIVCARK